MKYPKIVKQVMFVCTGNAARSVMGEYFMRKFLDDNKANGIKVISRGIAANPAYKVPGHVMDILKKEGIDAGMHRSTMITPDSIEESDVLLVMEDQHKRVIAKYFPEAKGKVFFLTEYSGVENPKYWEIDDPVGGDFDYYSRCAEQIRGCVTKIVQQLTAV
ncbi:MAG: hypothetical protein WC955_01285 [Elusimicrobiota bacterium]